jgi:tetratricopeptide (TPR) repeat protein
LIFRLAPEPVEEWSREVIEEDLRYWQELVGELLENPRYPGDFDARRSFSKLRLTGGRMYEHRGLTREAELAYRQSLALHPGNLEPLLPLSRILWARGEFDEPVKLWDLALQEDPFNRRILFLRVMAGQRREWAERSAELHELVEKDPGDGAAWVELWQGYRRFLEDEKAEEIFARMLEAKQDDEEFLRRFRATLRPGQEDEELRRVEEVLAPQAE